MGGGERTRTADFHVANVALYQLSYTPGYDWLESSESLPLDRTSRVRPTTQVSGAVPGAKDGGSRRRPVARKATLRTADHRNESSQRPPAMISS